MVSCACSCAFVTSCVHLLWQQVRFVCCLQPFLEIAPSLSASSQRALGPSGRLEKWFEAPQTVALEMWSECKHFSTQRSAKQAYQGGCYTFSVLCTSKLFLDLHSSPLLLLGLVFLKQQQGNA